MKTVLTIAGSDSIGGAGIQADLKTMCAHHVYGMTVITALTAQNTLGVQAIHTPPAEFARAQLDSIFNDIRPDAVKIGMLSNAAVIHSIAEGLVFHHAETIVIDPVMISTSNHRLLEAEAQQTLINELLPLGTLITPNLPEAAALTGMSPLTSKADMLKAASIIADKTHAAILVKGGHLNDCADDLLFADGQPYWYSCKHIDTPNTHGTGCTLSSAIASNLALGYPLPVAVERAKQYISLALQHDPKLGHGNGPLNHFQTIA